MVDKNTIGFVLIASLVTVLLFLLMSGRTALNSPVINVTGPVWEKKTWNLDNGSASGFDNGIFYGMAVKYSDSDFGVVSMQQGEMPHKWYNSSAKLMKEITIYKDKELPLYLTATINRTVPVEWYSSDPKNRWNNIGLDIMGDVGLDYYNTDISQPHALVIDFYHDTDIAESFYYQGAAPYDRDYRAAFPLTASRLDTGKNYSFKTRIDGYIRDALNHYGFDYFTVKYTEYYLEVKASRGSFEAHDVALTLGEEGSI